MTDDTITIRLAAWLAENIQSQLEMEEGNGETDEVLDTLSLIHERIEEAIRANKSLPTVWA